VSREPASAGEPEKREAELSAQTLGLGEAGTAAVAPVPVKPETESPAPAETASASASPSSSPAPELSSSVETAAGENGKIAEEATEKNPDQPEPANGVKTGREEKPEETDKGLPGEPGGNQPPAN
jgi:hypothetical protein